MAITSVVPGDYDGDSQMDVLLTMSPKGKAPLDTRVIVFWGNNQTLGNSHAVFTHLHNFHICPLYSTVALLLDLPVMPSTKLNV